MNRILKWLGVVLAVLVLAAATIAGYFHYKFNHGSKRVFVQEVKPISIPSDSVSIARGKVFSVDCRICHEQDFSGKDFFNDPSLGFISSPNISGGKGSATEKYQDIDWVRTLRHGLNPQHHPVFIMPSEAFCNLTDEDLGCLIAYMKTIKPIDKPTGPRHFTLLGKVLAGVGAFGNLYPYDIIDHKSVQSIAPIPVSNSIAYGEYFVRFGGCRTCHGVQLNGSVSPDPTAPPVPNLTPAGNLKNWNFDQFKETMRGGKTPEGKIMKPVYMPWPAIGAHDDTEIEALYNYLRSLPAVVNDKAYDKKVKKG